MSAYTVNQVFIDISHAKKMRIRMVRWEFSAFSVVQFLRKK